jgi:hypothetical protein
MMISTKGRYALRVLVDLAEHQRGEYIPLKEIAERQEISHKYLESIMAALSKDGRTAPTARAAATSSAGRRRNTELARYSASPRAVLPR